MNPDLDLTLQRLIHAPRATVWQAWTDPDRLAKWWVPAPARCRIERFEPRPGGAFLTQISDDANADFGPHMNASFLVVDELSRIVFTNAIDSQWRPANPEPVAMTAEITFDEHPDGTDYRVLVRHGDPAARKHHQELGFIDGWGSVTAQLAAFAEREDVR